MRAYPSVADEEIALDASLAYGPIFHVD